MDVPNDRSSHTQPTPRGGGVAIVLTTLVVVSALWIAGEISGRLAAALVGGGAAVAGVGWLDDQRGVAASKRAIVHAASAAWAVAWIGGPLRFIRGDVPPLVLAVEAVATIVAVVWLINLYNFMDGIDGIAGLEAVLVGGIGAVLLVRHGDPAMALIATTVAASALGFVRWNWSPARIFMGDAGSGFLGYVFAVIALGADVRGSVGYPRWLLLLLPFIFDATVTLVRRIARGDKWYSAHREHAYQRLAASGMSHAPVALGMAVITSVLGLVAVGIEGHVGSALAIATIVLAVLFVLIERRAPVRPATRR